MVGVVHSLGEGVSDYKVGDHVGVGWFGGHCGHCKSCTQDAWVCCDTMPATGVHFDGGYAEYMGLASR